MSNSYFKFKQFTIQQDRSAMKVTTDGCLFGAFVSKGMASWKGKAGSTDPGVKKVLDIGTGTGLLSMMVAQKSEVSIDAIEKNKDAAEQAAENVAASPWNKRINIIHADAKEFAPADKYDIIISNPPFYENELKGDDPKKNLAHHDDGLLLPELLSILTKNLKPGGSFYILVPYKRNEEVKKMFTGSDLYIQQLTLIRQSVNHGYFRIILTGKLKLAEEKGTLIDEMSIRDGEGQYTPAFIDLLKDYYLHF